MTREQMAQKAFMECCDPKTTVRYGEKRGRPFWNAESTQFMYVPAFHFTAVRCIKKYRYDAVDESGKVHSFIADDCCVLLTPIWAELPEGLIKLTVTALNDDGTNYAVCGARVFHKLAPFPADTPPKVRSYRDCAVRAFKYAMDASFIRHWLEHGVPDPAYDLNVYPSKMISSLVKSMISYAHLSKEDAETALAVAVRSADYLIGITPREGSLKDLPPTYDLSFCPDPEGYKIITPNWHAACAHVDTMMMTYPASVGEAYVLLEQATGDKKYLDEAVKIGSYYLDTIEENGSWFLVRSTLTGEPTLPNYISPLEAVTPFLMLLYRRTGETKWKEVSDRSVRYVLDTMLPAYNWEGQFEDTAPSANHTNLTHYGPITLAEYYAENYPDDEDKMALAEELMRFAEDQFVIWKRPYPFKHLSNEPGGEPYDPAKWPTPCALEQYGWYVPIDASASMLIGGFLAMYKAGRGIMYLAKARALCDMLTRVQHENGQIPTHWMGTPNAEENFWFNCMFASCRTLDKMTEYEDIPLFD